MNILSFMIFWSILCIIGLSIWFFILKKREAKNNTVFAVDLQGFLISVASLAFAFGSNLIGWTVVILN